MATTRIKNKLSKLVLSQLPEHVQNDYPTFIAFLEAYYEYLEQDQYAQELIQNALDYHDIDLTVDSFIKYFLKQYGDIVPRDILHDQRALVKHLKDLFSNKGNEKGYRLLFRLLFNKDIEFFYPRDQILIASDGKWVQDSTIFIKTIYGNPDSIVNKFVSVTSSSGLSLPVFIKEKNTVKILSGGIPTDSTNTFKFSFDNSKNIPINVGDSIQFIGYKGVVVASPTSATVLSGGSGFKVGDLFNITDGTGYGLIIKVVSVGSNGELRNVQILDYGINYLTDFYAYISPARETRGSQVVVAIGSLNIADNITGFTEQGYINQHDYTTGDYLDNSYVGNVVRTFTFNSTVQSGSPVSDAVISFKLGAKAIYPGYYLNNDGFLDDNIYIQNRDYYQPFSYVIKIDERLSDYKQAVLDILHPAGSKLFGDYTLTNIIDIGTEIEAELRFLINRILDIFSLSDALVKSVDKVLTDTVPVDEERVYTLTKAPFEESVVADDINEINVTKPLTDEISSVLDSIENTLNKAIDDNVIAQELAVLNLDKYIQDSVSLSDSGTSDLNPYAETGYFLEDYVGQFQSF